jgi:endoglucanase
MVMPGATKLARYAVQKSTAASLDFAAVMAQASRIYKKYNQQLPGLADSCLNAAIAAWKWAQKNPASLYNQNEINRNFEPKITTGTYGDNNVKDEWFWAAAELVTTTGKKTYYDSLAKGLDQLATLPSWANVRMLAYYTLIRYKNSLPSYAKPVLQTMEQRILGIADRYIATKDSIAFKTIMGQSKGDFIWGSSSVAANQGILLIYAYFITKDKKYIDNALTNLDYLLGRNATGYSFLTGVGSRQVMRPHHRPSIADGVDEPVPGLLSGGPNPGLQDHCHYIFTEPETAFSDTDCSYASNEIAINWNAPAVYLFNALEALQEEAGYKN